MARTQSVKVSKESAQRLNTHLNVVDRKKSIGEMVDELIDAYLNSHVAHLREHVAKIETSLKGVGTE